MSNTTDPTRCVDFGFAEVDFPQLRQPRLAVAFADGLQILLADRADLDLAAQLIATMRLTERRIAKGASK